MTEHAGTTAGVSAAGVFPAVALFDLDGTLLDSAPDMLATVNAMLAARGRAPTTSACIRPMVSKGARAMVSVAFPELDAAARDALIPEFLQRYAQLIGSCAQLFDGVEEVLLRLEQAGSRWGIVTNKPEYLARLILPQLGWEQRCAVLIGGDTLAERKPHPLPLLVAAERLGVTPSQCAYVGDDERDIQAARAAGMPSIAALWGYRLHDDDPLSWQADCVLQQPQALWEPAAWPRT
ncbi:phosphoglycolate phosphatase [Xanthomonas maliensis]|uniref:phosphoglycolate phosphatase n=1 Tax=Xanthomonas maliensis TaxID=1321368 RepID=UPI0003B4EFCF|nr:phosphoglycolate phosphatase [Xanthomonas maliensis]KAB7764890.1 phosphoglycolate phosphatase [Xanthomonas maliensis]